MLKVRWQYNAEYLEKLAHIFCQTLLWRWFRLL